MQAQYEALPYPPRNPEDEAHRLLVTYTEPIDKIAHYCYAGRPRFDDGFRALVAGGGTGDSLIYLAEQLRHTRARITYIDLSATSMEIAQARAAVRDLQNIDWLQASLLDLPALHDNGKLGLEKDIGFDYINCSGVLHHLPDPAKGLHALNQVMKHDGAMGLMLYGKYGRANIYPIQHLLALVRRENDDFETQVEFAVDVIEGLPKLHPLRKELPSWAADIETYGAAGIYDLLLHSQDRAYTVGELHSTLAEENLHLIEFVGSGFEAAYGYAPESFLNITDTQLAERLKALPRPERQAIAESACMQHRRHSFYVSRQPPSACIAHMSTTSVLVWHPELRFSPSEAAAALDAGQSLDISDGAGNLHLTAEPNFSLLLGAINGRDPLSTIASKVGVDGDTMLDAAENLLKQFNPFGWLFVRNP